MDFEFDIYDSGSMKKSIIKEFDLDEEDVNEIQHLNFKIETLKELISSQYIEDRRIMNNLIDELTQTKIIYKNWFATMQTKFNIKNNQAQQLNVNFVRKKLQVIG